MIILNGIKFAENENEVMESLFKPGGTATLRAKRNKYSVNLYGHDGEKIGVINRYGVIASATKMETGKWWYSYGLPDVLNDEKYGLVKQRDDVSNISVKREFVGGELIFMYK